MSLSPLLSVNGAKLITRNWSIEFDCMSVAPMVFDTHAEFIFGNDRYKQCEDCFFLYSLFARDEPLVILQT